MSYVTGEALLRAPDALEGLASGATLEHGAALDASLTLRTYADLQRNMDLLDAAAGLKTLATGGELQLDARGRHRAAVLAKRVRAEASA